MSAPLAIAALNAMDRDAFVAALDGIYEHAPWVAAAAWEARPFANRAALAAALEAAVRAAPPARQLALIRGHPELGLIADDAAALTAQSRAEQEGAGLAAAATTLRALNARYRARFGFPFIIAVRGRGVDEIAAAMTARLANARAREIAIALDEIARIAHFRLADRVHEEDAP